MSFERNDGSFFRDLGAICVIAGIISFSTGEWWPWPVLTAAVVMSRYKQ